MKKVSVIIPCYQLKEEWIKRLFRSLESQTIGMENLEVIFVVDASPDDTFERLRQYEEQSPEWVLLIRCHEKVGPGGARSLGILYASGEYVAFLDQDDWVEPCMYEHLYEKAVCYDCDVAESYNTRDGRYLWHEGEPEKTGKKDAFFDLKDVAAKKRWFAQGKPEERKYWAKIYRRTFLLEHQIDFPAHLKYDDNYFKGMVFYYAKRVYVLEEYLYHWMINPASISMQNDVSATFDRMKVELLKIQEYKKRGLFSVYYEEMEYIFLEQFFANTVNTFFTRNGGLPLNVLYYMQQETQRNFPGYQQNPYLNIRHPVWAMGEWIENALKGIAQVQGSTVEVPAHTLQKIAHLSFLDLLKADLAQEELDWYGSIYAAFDKVAGRIDYGKLREAF